MSHTLTRRNISAIAKLDFSELGHSQRIDAIAKALGYNTGASLMATLKACDSTNANASEVPVKVITAYGVPVVRRLLEDEEIHDDYGTMLDGEVNEIEFATEGELRAYGRGVEDCQGWDEGGIFISTADDTDHAYWKAKSENPGLSFVDWYVQHQERKLAELDEEAT